MTTTVSDERAILSDYVWNGMRADNAGRGAFISYSFERTPPPEYLPLNEDYSSAFKASFQPLTAGQQQAARSAFALWDDTSGVTFFEVPAGMGDIKLASFDFSVGPEGTRDAAAYAVMQPAGEAHPALGSVYVDSHYTAPDLILFLHEIGHTLGLKHPFDEDPVLDPALDNTRTTVMSYTDGGNRSGLGSLDVIAIRQLYGADDNDGLQVSGWTWNQATATLTQTGSGGREYLRGIGGYNVIDGGGGDDVLDGADQADVLRGGSGSDTLYGYGGNDHLYGQSASGGDDGGDRLLGGNGHDYLQGNAGADWLDGGAGDDRIQGGADNDRIFGGTGSDTINGNRGVDTIDGGAGDDVVRGGQDNDSITGGAGNDQLFGDLGNDTLSGGADLDLLTGGGGADVFSFADGGAGFSRSGQWAGYTEVIADFTNGEDRILLGQAVTSVLAGSAAGLAEATVRAQQLLNDHAGSGEVAAVGIGSDTVLFYASGGGTEVNAAIRLANVAANLIDTSDFIG